ncbi:hypothetical protein [Salinimicrobium sp. GXAS 041]|uniref:hypothetical protein n=1 Tax=Salinimicrobium sp. GXAS 041 TaxID=3400806 RepID=UPI003C769539
MSHYPKDTEEEQEKTDHIFPGNPQEETPELYSKNLILIFAILFSPIFSATLLVINLRNLGKRKAAQWVMLFGIGYLFATAAVLQLLNLDTSLTFIANVIGAAILNEYFWNKYIGRDTAYRKKSWIKPILISILIVLVIFSLLYMAAS